MDRLRTDVGKRFGRSIAFPPRIGANGQMMWSQGPQNIRESIQIILQTALGERIMQPDFGAGIGEFLFEPNTTANRRLLRSQVENALQQWEPRIRLGEVRVDPVAAAPQQVLITLAYALVSTGNTEQLALTITLGG